MNVELRTARKEYRDNISNARIHVGELYKRVNIQGIGIFHFKQHHNTKHIINYILDKIDTIRQDQELKDLEAGYYYDICDIGQD